MKGFIKEPSQEIVNKYQKKVNVFWYVKGIYALCRSSSCDGFWRVIHIPTKAVLVDVVHDYFPGITKKQSKSLAMEIVIKFEALGLTATDELRSKDVTKPGKGHTISLVLTEIVKNYREST